MVRLVRHAILEPLCSSHTLEARKLLVHVVGIWPISYAKKLVQCKGREGLVGTDLGAMDCGNPDVCST